MYRITRSFHTAEVRDEAGVLREIVRMTLRDIGVTCGGFISVDMSIWPIQETRATEGLCQILHNLEHFNFQLSSLEKVTLLFQGGYCVIKPYNKDPQFTEMQVTIYGDDSQE